MCGFYLTPDSLNPREISRSSMSWSTPSNVTSVCDMSFLKYTLKLDSEGASLMHSSFGLWTSAAASNSSGATFFTKEHSLNGKEPPLFSRSIYNTNSSNPVRKTTCIEPLCWSANPLGHQMSTIQRWPWYGLAPDTIEERKNTEKNRGKKQKMSMHNRKKEIETSQETGRIFLHTLAINAHRDTNALSINTVTVTKKQII